MPKSMLHANLGVAGLPWVKALIQAQTVGQTHRDYFLHSTSVAFFCLHAVFVHFSH